MAMDVCALVAGATGAAWWWLGVSGCVFASGTQGMPGASCNEGSHSVVWSADDEPQKTLSELLSAANAVERSAGQPSTQGL